MRVKLRSFVFIAGIALLSPLVPAQRAFGFCRAGVGTDPSGPCFEDPGVPLLTWTRGCSNYAFNRRVFERIPALDEAAVRAIFDEGFGAWAEVDCGRTPFLVTQLEATTRAAGAAFEWDVQNESVITVQDAAAWSELEYDPNAIALTTLFADADTGELFDVDMELNGGMGEFTDCGATGCGLGEIDLLNTVTHEAGHYLGLGHSNVPGATMGAYAVESIDKRTLEDDDREGYCALDLPEPESDGECVTPVISRHRPGTPTSDSGGCSIASPGSRVSAQAWPLVAALAWRARRRLNARRGAA